jgi:uncharacterized YigZ family protein
MTRWTLTAPAEFAQDIKKSRFLARAASVDDAAAAMQFVTRAADADARHNCWAYRIGNDYRWSDADEPAGTAGRPILAAIDGQQFDRVVVLVARWFGGIKLGAGGLVRAYGGSAAECLRSAQRQELVAQSGLEIRLGFEWLGVAHAALDQFAAAKLAESFDSDGVCLRVQVAADRAAALASSLRDATRGSARIEELGNL